MGNFFVKYRFIITFFAHNFESDIPTIANIFNGSDDYLIFFNLDFNIIYYPGLLKNRLWNTQSLGITNFYYARPHYRSPYLINVITL